MQGSASDLSHRQVKRARSGWECDVCDKTFTESRSYKRHMKTKIHSRNTGVSAPTHPCKLCRQHFARADLQARHESEVHNNVRRGQQSDATSHTISPAISHAVPQPYEARRRAWGSLSTTSGARLFGRCKTISFPALGTATSAMLERSDVLAAARLADSKCNVRSFLQRLSWPLRRLQFKSKSQYVPASLTAAAPPCPYCNSSTGVNESEIFTHMRQHLTMFHASVTCPDCKIDFMLPADLQAHLCHANKEGKCGFAFAHHAPCNGHHPRDSSQAQDRASFELKLREWENRQLRRMKTFEDEYAEQKLKSELCLKYGVTY